MESYLNRRYKKKQAEAQIAAGEPPNDPEQKKEQSQSEKKDQLSSECQWLYKIEDVDY